MRLIPACFLANFAFWLSGSYEYHGGRRNTMADMYDCGGTMNVTLSRLQDEAHEAVDHIAKLTHLPWVDRKWIFERLQKDIAKKLEFVEPSPYCQTCGSCGKFECCGKRCIGGDDCRYGKTMMSDANEHIMMLEVEMKELEAKLAHANSHDCTSHEYDHGSGYVWEALSEEDKQHWRDQCQSD
jgi:hypothetical protein